MSSPSSRSVPPPGDGSSPRWSRKLKKGSDLGSAARTLLPASDGGPDFAPVSQVDREDDVEWGGLKTRPPKGFVAVVPDVDSPDIQATPFERTVAGAKELSGSQAGFALLKCVLGAGSFILPSAFKSSGLLAGFLSLVVLACVNALTISQLSNASRWVQKKYPSPQLPTFQDVAKKIMGHRAWGIGVGTGMVLLLFGVLAVYVDLIVSLVRGVWGSGAPSTIALQLCLVPPMAALALLRDFRYLAWTSMVGNAAVLSGMVAVIAYGIAKHGLASPSRVSQFEPSTYSEFFGQATFLFCIQANTLPIAQAMKTPTRFPAVAQATMLGLAVVNGAFGSLGLLIFKDKTKGMVLDNLGTSSTAYIVIGLLLAVDLLFSGPILLSSPRRILERALVPPDSPHKTLIENSVRIGSVLVIVAIAIGVPNVNDLATLVGSLCSPVVAFILPPLFYLKTHPFAPTWLKAANIALIVFGLFSMAFCTQQQLHKMLK